MCDYVRPDGDDRCLHFCDHYCSVRPGATGRYTLIDDSTAKPFISRENSSLDRSLASSLFLGHRYLPFDSFFVIRMKPSPPSYMTPLIVSLLFPQKRNRVPSSSGSIPNSRRIIEQSPVIPRLRSVLPHLIMTLLKPFPSLSIADHRQGHAQGLF